MLNDTEKSGFFIPETNLNNLMPDRRFWLAMAKRSERVANRSEESGEVRVGQRKWAWMTETRGRAGWAVIAISAAGIFTVTWCRMNLVGCQLSGRRSDNNMLPTG